MQKLIALLIAGLALAGGACSSASGPRVPDVTPETPATLQAEAPEPAPDPVRQLLDAADRHFEEGQSELALGHLAQARAAFNTALEVLLESPQGVHGDRRVREHFDRLVDRIAALELTALAKGDGFTEREAEPASIDRLIEISIFDTAPPTAETAESVQADLEQTTHDLPIPLNERVLRFVELFQGPLREFLQEGLERGAQYLPMIQSVFRAEGLPLDLVYVPLVESAFKPTALSRARAKGVWQFMKGTGIENGLKQDWYVDERSNPAKATVAAAKYFQALYDIFGDWHLALASYNGGPGRVQRAIRRSGRKDFWSLSATSRYLPRETRNYVPMILAAVIIAKNPVKYGFDAVPPSPAAVETVDVPPAVDLRRIAEWAGVPVDEIQRLNPELRRWTTPIHDSYTLIVPAGSADLIRGQLALAPPSSLNALQWHVVKRGETLSSIARKLRVRRVDLAEANFLRTSARVDLGQKLLIPRKPSAALLARVAAGEPITADAVPVMFEDPPVEEVVYRVKRGDTLYEIARRFGTTVTRLKQLNGLRSNTLRIGTRLLISSRSAASAQQQ